MFWENFMSLCVKRGVSPAAVGRAVGIAGPSITGWKQGATPRESSVRKLAEYFGVPMSALIGTDPISEADAVAAELRAQASENAKKDPTPISREALMRDYLMSLYDRADEATREKMLQAAEGLLLGRPDLSKDGR